MKKIATSYWPVKIEEDVIVCVQKNVHSMSSYVMLEQEDWFEDEMSFVRKYIQPEMNALDIGANHGVYALSIAKKLTTGHVWAFEPTIAPGSMLARSIELNHFTDKVTWVHAGLSDQETTAEINISANSELNSLYAHNLSESKETIQLKALDVFLAAEQIHVPIDFVKLDAEGEEIKVLQGGARFFQEQSPLLMFELVHITEINHGLIEAVQALGYTVYRLLPDIHLLVEYDANFQDPFHLNLFACKPDRAQKLAKAGLLVDQKLLNKFSNQNIDIQIDILDRLKTSNIQRFIAQQNGIVSQQYLGILSVVLQAYIQKLDPVERFIKLLTAHQILNKMIADYLSPHQVPLEFLVTRIHLLHILGYRHASVIQARALFEPESKNQLANLPFLPPSLRFFSWDINKSTTCIQFIRESLAEFIEYRQHHSSVFIPHNLDRLMPLVQQANHSLEIERRALLYAKRMKRKIQIPANHPLFTSKNGQIWQEICFQS